MGTATVRRLGHHFGHLDADGSTGHSKSEIRRIPNTGGIAIAAGILIPMIVGIGVLWWWSGGGWEEGSAPPMLKPIVPHLALIQSRLNMAMSLVGAVLFLHVLGVVDDRKPLGPIVKLGGQFLAAFVMVYFFDIRLLTMLDTQPGLGFLAPWPSVLVTLLWFAVISNAINFLDNMDGLAGGVVAIAASLLLVTACANQQWLIASVLALMVGATTAFLFFNFPPATVFMGDGGSLILGYLLAFLTTRMTYFQPDGSGKWYGVLMPIIILAIPLYDLTSVVIIRLRQGKSPFVGDEQHFSHRFVMRGLSKRTAVLMIWGCSLVTGIGGVLLSQIGDGPAILVGVQTLIMLAFLGAYERASLRSLHDENDGSEE